MGEEATYRIGEVAELLNEKTYVLRYWETEFPQIAPTRSEKGQRLYSEADVSILKRIQQLLHEKGMTIEGARRILEEGDIMHDSCAKILPAFPDAEFINMLKKELYEMRKILTEGEES